MEHQCDEERQADGDRQGQQRELEGHRQRVPRLPIAEQGLVVLQADYKQKIDWNVAKQGVAFADVPNFESYMPAYNQTLDLLNTFTTKWQSTPGLDLDAEIAAMKSQMQAIWDKGGS